MFNFGCSACKPTDPATSTVKVDLKDLASGSEAERLQQEQVQSQLQAAAQQNQEKEVSETLRQAERQAAAQQAAKEAEEAIQAQRQAEEEERLRKQGEAEQQAQRVRQAEAAAAEDVSRSAVGWSRNAWSSWQSLLRACSFCHLCWPGPCWWCLDSLLECGPLAACDAFPSHQSRIQRPETNTSPSV
mmetsp:Transcript_67581/g.108862  ORF Transcript_67581/g.108862 Transcript_67581/m.108862 type:complete len:187 (+) Transcript_67581:96-656(+)